MKKKPICAKCCKFDETFTNRYVEYEKLVALNSKAFKGLFDWDEESNNSGEYEGLVCIQAKANPKRKVYRKAVGHAAGGFTKGDIMLGYRTRKQLNIQDGDEVVVKSACWFPYLWHHPDSAVRGPFRLALFFGVISLLSLIVSVISLYFDLQCLPCIK